MENDELDEIFVDRNEPINKKLLVEVLKPFVIIDSEGMINFSAEYEKLSGNNKILIYLCCKKAMVLKEIPNKQEATGITEASKEANVTIDIAKNAFYKVFNKLLKKEGDGYIIPNYNLIKIKQIIMGE
jgi:hypothetical protein